MSGERGVIAMWRVVGRSHCGVACASPLLSPFPQVTLGQIIGIYKLNTWSRNITRGVERAGELATTGWAEQPGTAARVQRLRREVDNFPHPPTESAAARQGWRFYWDRRVWTDLLDAAVSARVQAAATRFASHVS